MTHHRRRRHFLDRVRPLKGATRKRLNGKLSLFIKYAAVSSSAIKPLFRNCHTCNRTAPTWINVLMEMSAGQRMMANATKLAEQVINWRWSLKWSASTANSMKPSCDRELSPNVAHKQSNYRTMRRRTRERVHKQINWVSESALIGGS